MKKKLLSLLLASTLLLGSVASFAGCGKKNNPSSESASESVSSSGNEHESSSESTSSGPVSDNLGYDGSPVTIRFYHTMGVNLKPKLEEHIVEFNKLYPNITIEHETVGSYDDVRNRIKEELNVGDQPDLAYCYPDHVALYNIAKAVKTLDGFIASTSEVVRADGSKEIIGLTDEQKADFIQGYYQEGQQFGDGKMYSMPFSKSTEVLYYNKTFFDASQFYYTSDTYVVQKLAADAEEGAERVPVLVNRLPVATLDEIPSSLRDSSEQIANPYKGNEDYNISVPETWDELESVLRKIKKRIPNCIPLGYDSESNWFITMCEQYGSPYTSATGKHYLFDNETNRAFVKRFAGWYRDALVTTRALNGNTYTSQLFVQEEGTDLKSYMSIGSSAGATHQRPTKIDGEYPFEVGIASVPQVNPDKPKVISQGPSVCIFKNKDPKKEIASWLFLKYLITDVKFQAQFSMESGYIPVIKSVNQDPVYADFLASANGFEGIAAYSVKVALDHEDAYYASPAFNGSSIARDEVGGIMIACLPYTGADIDSKIAEAFEDAIDECEYQA